MSRPGQRLGALSWRLTLTYASLLALLLIALGGYLNQQLSSFTLAQLENRLTARAATFPQPPPGAPRDPRPDRPPGFVFTPSNLAAGLARSDTQGLTTTLLSPDGSVIEPAEAPANWHSQASLSKELFQLALASPGPHGPRSVATPAGRYVVLDQALDFGNQDERTVVQISAPLSDVDDLLRSFRIALLVGIAVTIAISLGIGRPFGRMALRPLGELTHAISKISPAQLSQPIPVPAAEDEVRELALAFNKMLEEIHASVQADHRSQQELRRSQEQLRRFVGDASHELRSPLTSLTGYLDLLAEPMAVPQDRIVEPMRREVDRMNRLVQDLLALTRLDATPSTPAQTVEMDLAEVADDILAGISSTAQDRHLSLLSVGDGPFPVVGDRYGVERMLENLLRNAIQHTEEDGTIELRLARSNGSVLLEVIDNGEGITPEHLPHVFDRFYRADAARGRSQGNVGLGLAIVKAVVEQHGGKVKVTSSPGEGSTFAITLPAGYPQNERPSEAALVRPPA